MPPKLHEISQKHQKFKLNENGWSLFSKKVEELIRGKLLEVICWKLRF